MSSSVICTTFGARQQFLCRYLFRAGLVTMEAISLYSPHRTPSFFPPCIPQHSLHLPTISPPHSLTAILISRFLVNLHEANLRSVNVDSDDPAYISSHSQNSLPSFVATPGTTGATGKPNTESMEGGMAEDRESAEVDHWEDDRHGVKMLPLAARV